MAPVREFLKEIDARWKPVGTDPITLQVIGSAALMLQTDYARGTKDGDVLESRGGPSQVEEQLISLAGEGTTIHRQFRLYIDVVKSAILFLPQRPTFHPLPELSLRNFKVEVLDVVDVVVSKLKPFRPEDMNDIRAMADRSLLEHERLVARFNAAADWFSTDSRAQNVTRYLRNLRKIERDILDVPSAEIKLPSECEPD